MLSPNDQMALTLIDLYLYEKADYNWLDISAGLEGFKMQYAKKDTERKVLDSAHQILYSLGLWCKGEDITDVYIDGIGAININYGLEDRGVLNIIRNLQKHTEQTLITVEGSSDPDVYIPVQKELTARISKAILLMELWNYGEDVTYFALKF